MCWDGSNHVKLKYSAVNFGKRQDNIYNQSQDSGKNTDLCKL